MHGPDPQNPHPLTGHERVGFLKPLVTAENVEIGEYTYYDDPEGPAGFYERCVLYHYPFVGDVLRIGKFCALATGVKFIMNGANHAMGGVSTYPFNIFGGGWEEGFDPAEWSAGHKGDTEIGHDVWIGYGVTIMPGVKIGHGAIIASKSVVTGDIPPYAIAGGNPAKVIRSRFDEETVERLLALNWWDWPPEKIGRHARALGRMDLDALEGAK
ncbi:CatB-related O-acetyltransferase [Parvularcula marina]|uniref:CatB-related O-acetyltransferase n=1 Tax=Parvularcula marina TaxID=2292771 RepID=UPI0035195E0C